MKDQLLRNLLLSLAFSCIVAGSVGYAFSIEKYYSINKSKEISIDLYKDIGEKYAIKESKFNSDLAWAIGLVSFGLCFIILTFAASIKQKSNEKKLGPPTKKR